jgi:arylsulfatase A-like enzyme
LNIDLAPTLLEFAQVVIPGDIEGQSLVPVLRGTAKSWRASFLIESFGGTGSSSAASPAYRAVRTVRMKYIRSLEANGAEELYDNNADRYEMINLAGRASAINELRRQRAELAKLLRSPR